jgi:hypothetical protein
VSRRMQLTEQAHLESPSAPSYDAAEHYLGVPERRGGALLAPALHRHVAARLRDETAVLKEKRKAAKARQGARASHFLPTPKAKGGPPAKSGGTPP